MNEKLISWDLVGYFIAPFVLMGSTFLIQEFTSNLWAIAFAHLTIIILLGILQDFEKRHGRSSEDDRVFQAMTAMFILDLLWFRSLLSVAHLNPWGTIGWVVAACAVILAFIITFTGDDAKYMEKSEAWSVGLLIVMVIGTIAQLYLYWGTQYVWVPLVLLLVTGLFIPRIAEEKGEFKTLLRILLVIGIANLITQFWHAEIVAGYAAWELFIAIVLLAIGLEAIALISKGLRNKALAREKRNEQAQRDAERRAERLREEERRAQEDLVRLEKAKELYVNVTMSDAPHWDDILFLVHAGYSYGKDGRITWEMVSKANILELFEASNVKKQLFWDPGKVNRALTILDTMVRETYNDDLLQGVIDQFKGFEQYTTYKGYENFGTRITTHHRDLDELVRIKYSLHRIS